MIGNRREFLKQGALAGAGLFLIPTTSRRHIKTNEPVFQTGSQLPQPTPAQKAWMDLKFGLFIHFGINTYYDVEWSDGTLDPIKFNPTELDTDQWCRAAAAAGMKYIVVVTKHHDGFCLWPTKYTDYSIKATPFKEDYLARVANSAAKYGLKVGMYYSLWDRHEKTHDNDEYAYVEFMKNQLFELLTGYGEVIELWFDGFWKKQRSGWEKSLKNEAGAVLYGTPEASVRDGRFIQAWRNEGAYRWQMDHLYQYVKSLQPNCIVMNNSTTEYPGVPLHPVDARNGEKFTDSGVLDRNIWTWLGKEIFLPLQIETTLSVKGNDQFPKGNWFWHEWDHSVLTPSQIKNLLAIAQQMEANLLLNAGITDKGRLRQEDEWALLHLND